MRILFLTNNNNTQPLINWLKNPAGEEVIVWNELLTKEVLKKLVPDFVISYNYTYLLEKEILDFLPNKLINLHISFLPYNRGSNPNIWSFLDDTPKGITIHYIDEGIDTGDIIIQKEILFDEEQETLRSSYKKLHEEIQELFKKNWVKIKMKDINPQKQSGVGSMHTIKEFSIVEPLLKEKGWDISIRELKEKYKNLIKKL
jgi:methionyl-tRNA formyltransferase